MQKVALLAHKSVQEDLLEFLYDAGVLEVTPNEETEDIEHPKVSYEKAEVLFAIDFLRPAADKAALQVLKKPGSDDVIRHAALHTDFRAIIDDCKTLEDRSSEITNERQHLSAEEEKLLPWKGSPVSLEKRETDTTTVRFGVCPESKFESFAAATPARVSHLPIQTDGGQTFIVSTVWKKDEDAFDQVAAVHGWTEVDLPKVTGTPAEELTRIAAELAMLDKKEKELNAERTALAAKLPDLVRLMHYLNWIDQKQAVRSEFATTEQTIKLSGWVPKKEYQSLEGQLANAFPAVALMKDTPKEDEEPPIQIKNISAIAPFEAVTRLYGLPQGSEMDPTRPLMPFFILYFGLCLTDAGYGAVIALLLGTVIWKFKLKRQEQKLIWLLFYAGIVTFFVSIPFGGWFGITPDQVPAFLTYVNANGDLRFLGQIWDLTKDVDFFRNLALALGAIQFLFGIFLAGYWKAIHGKVFEAFTNHFAVHFFVAALALKYLLHVPFMNPVLIIIGAFFIWGQGKGPWFVRPLIGALGSVNFLISVMSTILSYLRILALGLATGALAFAINQVALVMKDLLPIFIGIPVFLSILFFGHVVSIALNGLGSFVHSGRLQFIEFFGQFFQGGGREFSPFKRSIQAIS